MSNSQRIRDYIKKEFIPDDIDTEISNDMDLIKHGIMDSLAVLKLVAFIENNYNISLLPEEIDPENLNSIDAISSLIDRKESDKVASV